MNARVQSQSQCNLSPNQVSGLDYYLDNIIAVPLSWVYQTHN